MSQSNSFFDCKPYTEIDEATDMLNSKKLSVATLNEFGVCYIPANTRCRTDLLWERLGLPIHDFNSNIIAHAGRKMDSRKDIVKSVFKNKYPSIELVNAKMLKWEKSKWINEPYEKSKNLFNINRAYNSIIENNYVIVVEGYFDVMALWDKRIYNVVATCGTTLSRYQAFFIKALCNYCLLMFDPDEAGVMASEHARETLGSIEMENSILVLPDSMDPDDYVMKKKPSALKSVLDTIVENKTSKVYLN